MRLIFFSEPFLIDKNLGGMVWVSAEGNEVDPASYIRANNSGNSRCENFVCDSSILASGFKKVENLTTAPLKYLAFDIECLPLDGGMPSPDVRLLL